jgi:3',5'-cyclic AMP phosphodiesterase CpdA
MRFLHVSDLHFGAGSEAGIAQGLDRLVGELQPELIVASGDLAHRGRRGELEASRAFLEGLGEPLLVVPGNHDIPYRFPQRFTSTFAEFERVWESTEPVYRTEEIVAVGINSVRPWRHQSGGVRQSQLERTANLLAEAAPGALRVVVLHHHLIGAPWRSRKKPVAHRNRVLAGLVDAGAELILAGHIHQAAVSERHEFEVTVGDVRAVTVSIAPGLGQPRPQRRGEARGVHAYEVTGHTIAIETRVWRDGDWALTGVRRFPRGTQPLAQTGLRLAER